MNIGKVDVEKAFLGGCILDDLCELYGLTQDNFIIKEHKIIFNCIKDIKDSGGKVDLVSIKDKIGELIEFSYLMEIVNGEYSLNNQEYYSNILKKETKRIELIRIADEINLIAKNTDNINQYIFDYANKLMSLNTLGDTQYSIDNVIYETMEYLDQRKGKELFGYSWGDNLKFLDDYTKGIQQGRTYRIGAPSNLGKTVLLYNVINSLLKQNCKVAFFTLENDKSFTITNIMANYQKVNAHKIEDGTIDPDVDYIKSKDGKFFLIDDCYELGEIFSRTLELKPDVVLLDYIGLVQIKKVKEDDKYTEYSKQVQEFVKRSRISWIDLSNLPNDQQDEDSIKIKKGFYGSSFLRNNADVGIHLYYHKPFYQWRDDFLNLGELSSVFEGGGDSLNKARNMQVAHLYISKNRIGIANLDKVFKINFNEGGMYQEATQQEKDLWKK